MRKLARDPTTHACRPTGNNGDSACKSSHLSEDYDAFPPSRASGALAPAKSLSFTDDRLGRQYSFWSSDGPPGNYDNPVQKPNRALLAGTRRRADRVLARAPRRRNSARSTERAAPLPRPVPARVAVAHARPGETCARTSRRAVERSQRVTARYPPAAALSAFLPAAADERPGVAATHSPQRAPPAQRQKTRRRRAGPRPRPRAALPRERQTGQDSGRHLGVCKTSPATRQLDAATLMNPARSLTRSMMTPRR
jgi:hypothetical protein